MGYFLPTPRPPECPEIDSAPRPSSDGSSSMKRTLPAKAKCFQKGESSRVQTAVVTQKLPQPRLSTSGKQRLPLNWSFGLSFQLTRITKRDCRITQESLAELLDMVR